MHESGESVNLAGYGQGVDSQDKGAGKATTYALKNCLLYTFLTPVGKMPDTELIHSDDIETPPMIKTLPLLTKELETAMLKAISNGDSATVLVRLKKYKYSSNQEYRINDAINTYAAFIAKTEGGK